MYHRILVPIDGSATSQRGLEEAIRLAKLTNGRLRLFHVIDELSFALAMDTYAGFAGDWLNVLRENGNRLLEDGRTKALAAGVEVESQLCERFTGSVHALVNADAAQWKADLIVLGTHGRRGIGRAVMGSSAEQILRYAPVPVLLVRAPEDESKTLPESETTHVSLRAGELALE